MLARGSAILALLSALIMPGAAPLQRIPAAEAHQGVAAGVRYVYAIANADIGKYDKTTGNRVLTWHGDPAHFRHMNSCTLVGPELVCAASNYPATPHQSMIERFDADTLVHLGTTPLPQSPGSLTVFMRHRGHWWAIFANYDGRGGVPGQDHRATLLVELDDDLHELRRLTFPDDVLARFAPRSCSGGAWGPDGLLYVTGHDRPELYALRVPETGTKLEHVATWPIPTNGQAIDWDPATEGTLWSIERDETVMVATPVIPWARSGSRGNH